MKSQKSDIESTKMIVDDKRMGNDEIVTHNERI